jgi:hypothetical protein
MSKLTAQAKRHLPKSAFGLLGTERYPMPDRRHVANAKARASQQEAKGTLSEIANKRIDAKADKILGKKSA